METVVFLDRRTVPVPLPRLSFPHDWKEYDQTAPSELNERLKDATIAVTNKVALRQPVLENLPKLRMIAVSATGYDCVDAAWCRAHRIAVANVPGYSQRSVADHTMMLIL